MSPRIFAVVAAYTSTVSADCPCAGCPDLSKDLPQGGACCHGAVAGKACTANTCQCEYANWLPTTCTGAFGVWCPATPSPPPSPVPTPKPTPVPTPTPTPGTMEIGYWDWTWEPSGAPAGATIGVAFNGWAEPAQALSDSEGVYNSLVGKKYISIGGGNDNGAFTKARLQTLVTMINAGQFSKYKGIALDVEECHETGLASAFLAATAAAKSKGMETMVTISHSKPYGCSDGRDLMLAFFKDQNCDFLSPQLYTSGGESRPDFTAVGVDWEEYIGSHARIIPSIVDGTHYAATKSYFAGKGVTLNGYVQWAHARSAASVAV